MSIYKLLTYAIILAIFMVAISCGQEQSGDPDARTGSIALSVKWPEEGRSPSSSRPVRRMLAALPGVVTMRVIISGSGMSPMQMDFDASAGSGTITGVPAGDNRTADIQGLDSVEAMLYHGSVNNITVTAGRTSDAGFVTMTYIVPTTWVSGTIDSAGSVGWYTSIALDSGGKAHISYWDRTNTNLKYSTNASGSWVATTVDSAGSVGSYTSIALDSGGNVHISYWDSSNTNLKYATNALGFWVAATIDSSGDVGEYTSIALDSGGNVHISYYNYTNYNLKYATNASGSWVMETVDSAGLVGEWTSIALDSSGKAHISYFDSTNHDLKYATNASGSWVLETVDSAGWVGQYTSIAVDSGDNAHISSGGGNLKYATNALGSWVATTVDSDGSVGEYTSLALDSNGKAHISYHDDTNNDLKYATNK